MSRLVVALVLAVSGLTLSGLSTSTAAPVDRAVSVTGVGVGTYPAFTPSVERYGVTTTGATGGTVTVDATTTDGAETVLVNGRPSTSTTTLTDLEEGDEISVIFDGAEASTSYSFVYLPPGFPTLEAVVDGPGVADGMIGLTLSQWNGGHDQFETIVDRHGVPVYVQRVSGNSMDLKSRGDGSYSVSRVTDSLGRSGHALVTLDPMFRPVSSVETAGLEDTDGHDSLLLPTGHLIQLAYEHNSTTGLTDAVIQELDSEQHVVFEWNSADHVSVADENTGGLAGQHPGDYAHINSVQVLPDGHLLASFRHTSSVMKIARRADGGYAAGDVMWRLGGKLSDFEFIDDPHAGPCAQHTAYAQANGNIVIFDNGSWDFGDDPLCVDPQDRSGPSIARPFTRVTEYELDEDAMTARLVWSYDQQHPTEARKMWALFAGSSQRLPNGNTLIGWASERSAMATEVNPAKDVVWELRDANPTVNERFFSYRAFKFDAPDAIPPEVTVPASTVQYTQGAAVSADFACTDRGGFNLQSCESDLAENAIDTLSRGPGSFTVTATDGAGNTTTKTGFYEIVPARQPDAMVRSGSRWVGADVYGGWEQQRATVKLTPRKRRVVVTTRLQNDGQAAERLRVRGARSNRQFKVVYLYSGTDVTRQVTSGTWRTPRLAPGKQVALAVRVVRAKRTRNGVNRTIVVTATGGSGPETDRIGISAQARR